ncbi:NtrZ family periplasmic regulatory protein [Maricaulis sp.]|uniref:NtrZ family periplasmic regulatory protein n=1 Tax=Maricaulis sp. TaxID=1486257 RepID=UPI00261C2034|nr:hypothetical protein [Maricaulis sp.]
MTRRSGKSQTRWLTRSAVALTALTLVCAPAMAQDDDIDLSILDQPILDADAPWYDSLTNSLNETRPNSLEDVPTVDLELGDWSFQFGLRDDEHSPLELDDVSAGAFVNLGDRFRLGTELRFTAPEDDLLMMREAEERAPEIKFESALRF